MLGRTFRTLKKNPKILLLFAAMYAVPLVIYVVAFFSIFPNISNAYMFEGSGLNENFFIMYFATMGTYLVLSLAMITLVVPSVLNYIYEVCAGIDTKGWYKRGLQRNWWKLLVLFIIYIAIIFAVMLVIGIIAAIAGRAFWIAFILLFIIMIPIVVYLTIAIAAIIAEDDFGRALGNVFKLGSKFFFKLLGNMVLIAIPSYIFSAIYSGMQMRSWMNDSFSTMESYFSTGYIVMMVFTLIYGMLAYAYLYTYTMNSYLNEKGMFDTPAPNTEGDVGMTESIVIEADIERMDR